MKKLLFVTFSCFGALLSQGQNLISNCSFELNPITDSSLLIDSFTAFQAYYDTSSVPLNSWTVVDSNHVDLHNKYHFTMGCPPGAGDYHIDVNPWGKLRQTGITLQTAKTYILSFWTSVHSNLVSDSAVVKAEIKNTATSTSIFAQSVAEYPGSRRVWTERKYTFTTSGTSGSTIPISITFSGEGSKYSEGGVLVDSVVLEEDITANANCSDTCYWKVTGNNILRTNRNIFGTLSNDDVRIFTNNTQRGLFSKSGEFGWNTTTPTAKMHIDVTGSSATNGLRLQGLPSATDTIALTVDAQGNVHTRTFPEKGTKNNCTTINQVPKVTSGGDLSCSQIFDNGVNVGINTTSPAAQLHQSTAASTASAHKFSNGTIGNSASDGFDIGIGGTGIAEIRQRENLGLNFYTNDVQRATIDAAGSMGLNIASPAAQLHQAAAASTAIAHKFSNATVGNSASDGFDLGIGTTGIAEIRQRESLGINFYTSNLQRATIDAAGNMGLNNTSPAANLDISNSACDNRPAVRIVTDGNSPCPIGSAMGNYIECYNSSGFPTPSLTTHFIVTEAGCVGVNRTPSTYTAGTGTWLGSAPASQSVRLDVNGLTRSVSFVATSDGKYKDNVVGLKNSLSNVMKLNGVEYNWKTQQYPEKQFDQLKHNGFIAQELMEVIPNAVVKDKDGDYAVDYNAIIPVLTESIKEQQKQIESQQAQIEELKKLVTQNGNKAAFNTTDIAAADKSFGEGGYLAQNIPNPFSNNTEIKFQLPTGAQSGMLGIYDLNGKQVKLYPINTGSNAGSITVQAQELQAGMYIYTLIVDGRAFDSKRMLLTAQ